MGKLNILIADDEPEILEILDFFVSSAIDCSVQTALNGQEAIEKISQTPFDLIICDYNMPLKNGGEVYSYLLENNSNCRYVMCSSDTPDRYPIFNNKSQLFGNIQKPNIKTGVLEVCKRLEHDLMHLDQKNHQEYNPISLNLLLRISIMPSDIFIRLSESHFLKVISAGDLFDETDLILYQKKGIEKLYILNFNKDMFIDKIQSLIESIMKDVRPENRTQSSLVVHDILISTFRDYGFNPLLIPSVDQLLRETVEFCKSEPSLNLLLSKILKAQGGYLGRHSFLLVAVTNILAKKLGWTSSGTELKLTLASLFHDIFLKEDVTNEGDCLKKNVIDEAFLSHPQRAAELLEQIPAVPPDTDRIIIEQHEIGDPIGLPKKMSFSQVSPLGQLFVFSHLVVDIVIELNGRSMLSSELLFSELKTLEQRSPKYKKFLSLLESVNIL